MSIDGGPESWLFGLVNEMTNGKSIPCGVLSVVVVVRMIALVQFGSRVGVLVPAGPEN